MSGWFEDSPSSVESTESTPEVVETTPEVEVSTESVENVEVSEESSETAENSIENTQSTENTEEITDLPTFDLTSDEFSGVFKAKVNGEIREYDAKKVQEAINADYYVSSEKSKLDKERNEWYSKVEAEKSELLELDKSNPIGAWAKYKGIPEYAAKEQLIKLLEDDFYKRAGAASEKELESIRHQDELDYYRRQDEARAAEEAAKQQESAIVSLKSEHKIEDSEWDKALTFLDKMLPPDAPLNASSVVNYILEQRKIESHTVKESEEVDMPIYNDITALYEGNKYFTDNDKNELKEFLKENPGVSFDKVKSEVEKYVSSVMDKDLARKATLKPKENDNTLTESQKAFVARISGEEGGDSGGSWFYLKLLLD